MRILQGKEWVPNYRRRQGSGSHFLMSKLKNFHQILDSFVIDFFIALDIEPFFSYHQQLLLHEQLHPFHVVLLSHHLPVLGCSMRSTIFVFIQQGWAHPTWLSTCADMKFFYKVNKEESSVFISSSMLYRVLQLLPKFAIFIYVKYAVSNPNVKVNIWRIIFQISRIFELKKLFPEKHKQYQKCRNLTCTLMELIFTLTPNKWDVFLYSHFSGIV